LGYFIKLNEIDCFKLFEAHEKFSFNLDSIPDESLIIIQAINIKKKLNLNKKFELILNRTICHICNKEVLSTSRIILKQCQHCYCFDCMEAYCNKITKGSMKNSDFNRYNSSAFCQVKNCNSLFLFSDVQILGKLNGEVKESKIISRVLWFQICSILKQNGYDKSVWLKYSGLVSKTQTASKQWDKIKDGTKIKLDEWYILGKMPYY
jgi:hypothetical protein